ncbi:MAG: hypothetical protein OCD02_20975 [Spirochaetaceae bacterium]
MKKKLITIEKVIAGGDGLGFIDGKAHFVTGALPGEILEINIITEKKGFNRCSILKIVKASEFRVLPFCDYYNSCGGCNLQFTSYDHQISLKTNMVKDIFLRNGKIELNDFNFITSKDLGYRNRVQFHISNNRKGFKKRKSNEIVNIDCCPLLVDPLNTYINEPLKSDVNKINVFANDEKYFVGGLDKEASVLINNKEVCFNPNGFFQSNLSILPKLIETVNQFILGCNVMDLYCGVGLFSTFLPESVNKIIAVEIDQRVKPFLDKNLGSKNYLFYPMSIETYISKGHHEVNEIDTIIVDPPREGLSNIVRSFLINSKVKRIIYISCDPTTMARDISEIKNNGYSFSSFSCFDFYPHTTHIEALGILDLE